MSGPVGSFDFRGTHMTVQVRTEQSGGQYAVIAMVHPPSIGPALHVHPRGAEVFLVLEGRYDFVRGDEAIAAGPGDCVVVPAGVPHRYRVGPDGGRVIVVCPPSLELYFETVAAALRQGPLALEREFEIAASFGQEFLDHSGHWSASPLPVSPS